MLKPAVKISMLISCCLLACGGLTAQTREWQPSPGHTQVAIWPGAAPDARRVPGKEVMSSDPKFLIAGKPVVGVTNVTKPTMTVYSPEGKNTGVTVVVFPVAASKAWPSIWKARRSATGSWRRELPACC